MPQRRLSKSATARLKAMRTGKDRKDAIPAPLVILPAVRHVPQGMLN